MEQGRFGGIEIFCRCIFFERPPAKGNDPPLLVGNRKHHAIAELVEGNLDILARHQKASLLHILRGNAFACEIITQGITLARGIAHAKPRPDLRPQSAPHKIGTRLRGCGLMQLRHVKVLRHGHDVIKGIAPDFLRLGLRTHFGQGHTGIGGELFDRLVKAQTLRFHDKFENIAMFSRGKTMKEAFLVIDREGGCFFRIERGQAFIFATRLD